MELIIVWSHHREPTAMRIAEFCFHPPLARIQICASKAKWLHKEIGRGVITQCYWQRPVP